MQQGNFNTDLLMYMLSALGPAIGGEPWMKAAGAVTQQQISAKSARDVLAKLLGAEGNSGAMTSYESLMGEALGGAGNEPFSSQQLKKLLKLGASLKADKDGMKLDIPRESFGQGASSDLSQATGVLATPAEGGTGTNWNLNNIPKGYLDAIMRANLGPR